VDARIAGLQQDEGKLVGTARWAGLANDRDAQGDRDGNELFPALGPVFKQSGHRPRNVSRLYTGISARPSGVCPR